MQNDFHPQARLGLPPIRFSSDFSACCKFTQSLNLALAVSLRQTGGPNALLGDAHLIVGRHPALAHEVDYGLYDLLPPRLNGDHQRRLVSDVGGTEHLQRLHREKKEAGSTKMLLVDRNGQPGPMVLAVGSKRNRYTFYTIGTEPTPWSVMSAACQASVGRSNARQ